MKVFNYFISYFYTTKEFGFGFGNCNNNTNRPIKSIKDIQELEKLIQKNFNFKEVSIISYKILNYKERGVKHEHRKKNKQK